MATKFETEKFNGNNDFDLWRLKMYALLIQNGLQKALKGNNALSDKLLDDENDELLEKVYGQLVLFFSNGELRKVAQEKNCCWHMAEVVYHEVSHESLESEEAAVHITNVGRCQACSRVEEKSDFLGYCSYVVLRFRFRNYQVMAYATWHMSERGMDELIKQGLLCSQKTGKLDFCEHCIFRKHCRVKFRIAVHRTKSTLDYIHSDIWGSSCVPSLGGGLYMLTFIDDYSWKVWVYILKHKHEAFTQIKQWKAMIEKHTGKQLKRLRNDNDLEFCNS
ncbi:hypothetical protein AAC387_Pa04g1149 [Persea americana]